MVFDQKVIPLAWTNEAIDAFSSSADCSPFGPLASPGEICAGSYLYEYFAPGQHAIFAIKPVTFSAGTRIEVAALRSFGNRLSAKPFYAAVEQIGRLHDARMVVMCTQHQHIAKACQSAGFGISGAIAMKVIDPQ